MKKVAVIIYQGGLVLQGCVCETLSEEKLRRSEGEQVRDQVTDVNIMKYYN